MLQCDSISNNAGHAGEFSSILHSSYDNMEKPLIVEWRIKVREQHGIIVFGANGCGKTTIGSELSHILGYKHMDHESYAFEESETPYTMERSNDESIELMLADIKRHRKFILSAVIGNFGEAVSQYYALAVYVKAPIELRMKRLEQRAYEQNGDRILSGGDMYDQHVRFIDFAKSRSLERIEKWAETLTCPLIHIDGTEDCKAHAIKISEYFRNMVYRIEDIANAYTMGK